MKKTFWPVLFTLSISIGQALGSDKDGRLEAQLIPSQAFAQAHGKAQFKNRGGEREFELEVEEVRQSAGQRLRVMVDGVLLDQALVNRFGKAALYLNSTQRENIPVIQVGSSVEVRTAANALVVSGKF